MQGRQQKKIGEVIQNERGQNLPLYFEREYFFSIFALVLGTRVKFTLEQNGKIQ